jgi:hypothetical protein
MAPAPRREVSQHAGVPGASRAERDTVAGSRRVAATAPRSDRSCACADDTRESRSRPARAVVELRENVRDLHHLTGHYPRSISPSADMSHVVLTQTVQTGLSCSVPLPVRVLRPVPRRDLPRVFLRTEARETWPSPRHERLGSRVVTVSRLQASLDVAARGLAPAEEAGPPTSTISIAASRTARPGHWLLHVIRVVCNRVP